MTSSGDEDGGDIYDKLIEPNRYRIVKYFDPFVVFDIMRSKAVFTMDDQERVMNMYPPTRRARAGQFLDILLTKGDNGVKIFIEVLEYDYPHVYKLITNKDAKEPPRTFKQHRESIRSKWIDKTGEFVDMIKNQFNNENVNLRENLEDLKAVVTLNQENIQASENESNELRDKMRIISGENDELKEQNGSLLRERDRLKDDNLKIQKDCIEYFKERDLYKDKIRHVQLEKEHIEKEMSNLSKHITELKSELKLSRNDVRDRKFEKIQTRLEEIKTEQDTLSRSEMEKQILREEIVETQVKVEELVEEMDNLRVELDKSQADCSKLREKIEREKKERTQLEQWRQEKDKTIENYFERIGELESDKQSLEGERNREQQKNRELDLKISKLFSEKHQWQQSVEAYRKEISELKKRKSLEVQIPPVGPQLGEEQPEGFKCCPPVPFRLISEGASNKSSESSEDLTECLQLEVALDTLPWTIDQCAGRPVSGPFIRSGSYEDTREKWTVKMKMPLLDKISICGGNFTGIFVEKTKNKEKVLKPGDKIESMCKITEGYEQQDRTSFDGFTQSQAKEKLSFKHHSDEMEVTFRRRKINNTAEFDCAKLWMADAKNSKRGDYFYVRANSPYNPDGAPGLSKHKIQTGDIYLVQDTCPLTAGEWQALKFDKKRGDWGPLCQAIPDSNHSRRQFVVNRQQSSDQKQGRHRAFKKRSLYTNVFPMKATSKLPVWMVGPQDVVLAIQNLMCQHYPAEFVTAHTGNFQQVMSGVRMQDKHVLVHINTQSSTDRIGILLLFTILNTDKQKLSEILKKNVNPDATTINEEILRQQGLEIGEVKIPCNSVKDESTLVDTVYNKINSMQKQILWLCENRLRKYKPDVLSDYKCFFTESNVTMAYSRFNSSQEEQSNAGQEVMSNAGQETSSNTGKEEPLRVRKESIALDRDVCNSWAGEEDHC
ncbi:caspase recruitment domain-containing protein 14-like isoform X2 [Mytilus edulis]|uniref:caspase recruitment domain-containing protein 14-like isoform X2 n=1 Tax=Mytilus edulis TaxID=6550 RepID=UPI0039EF90D8